MLCYIVAYRRGQQRQSLWQQRQRQRQRKWPLDCLWFPPFQIVVAAAAAVFLPSSLFLGKHLPPIMTGRDKESETVDSDNKLDNSMISCSSCIFICRRLCRLWLKLELTFACSMSDGFTLIRRYFLHCITLFWAKRLRLMSVYVHI